jgi:hypothetical protein
MTPKPPSNSTAPSATSAVAAAALATTLSRPFGVAIPRSMRPTLCRARARRQGRDALAAHGGAR